MSIRITELDAITSLQSGDYIAVDNESTGTHKFDALNIGANIGQNIANTYSSSASYAIGQYCLYDNNLYKCTTTISTPEAWNSSHWIQVTVGEGLYEKVDKVSGKGLSTNDFTNEYKQKLGGIEAGAEVNVQANWAEPNTSSDSYIQNKPGNATTETSGFMSASDKQKLNGIASGAEVNVQPNWTEDDSSKDDYIKNKPTIDTALSASSDNAVRNSAITAGINQVQGNLDTEITNRQNAVSGEQLARENADSALDGRLDTVEETLPNKANINGSYEEMTVGSAEQLISTESIENSELYTFRASGGGMDIGDRETDKLVGGTIAWNQLLKTEGATRGGITSVFSDGVWSFSGTTTTSYFNFSSSYDTTKSKPKGHVYLSSWNIIANPNNYDLLFYFLNGSTILPVADNCRIARFDNTDSSSFGCVGFSSAGAVLDGTKAQVVCFDLTQMFGSTIADALYAMEQAESGSGVAWFKKYFPNPYYAYDAGSLQSVNVASHDMTGFNQWDEVWDIGDIDGITGEFKTGNYLKTKNLVRVLSNTSYYINIPSTIYLYEYDVDENAIVNNGAYAYHKISTSGVYTTDSRTSYISFRNNVNDASQTYGHNICINRVWTGNRNGEYEPYELHSYAYDESVELRGIPSLVDGELIYDGDTYEADGTVNRKYGYVDLGTVDWNYEPDYNRHGFDTRDLSLAMKIPSASDSPNVMMSEGKYNITSSNEGWAQRATLTSFAVDASGYARIYNDGTADATAFKTAMSGVYLVYELDAPTSEQATGFTNPQVVDAFGTEEYVDAGVKNGTRDVSIPVGHVTQYMANLRDKLQHLPNLTKEDGDYFVNQTGTQMKLKKVEGYYEDLVSGMADNLTTKIRTNDQTPYLFRTAGGSVDIGDREYINGIVGGTVAFNQLWGAESRSVTSNGITVAFDVTTGELTVVVPSAPSGACQLSLASVVPTAHKYLVISDKALISGMEFYSGAINLAGSNSAPRNQAIVQIQTSATQSAIYFYVGASTTEGTYKYRLNFIDLTQMFGSTIADYIYSLETATAGAGVAFFKTLFPKPYYAYNAGELKSVKGLVSHDMVGFNAFDKSEASVGDIAIDGTVRPSITGYRVSDYIPVVSGATYYFKDVRNLGDGYSFAIYDANKSFVKATGIFASGGNTHASGLYTIPAGIAFIRAVTPVAKLDDCCINLSWDGSEDGNYEPYQKWSYPLDSDLELRGIPKLDASNNLYYDGDVYESDGTVARKYGIVDLGTLTWARRNVSGYPHPDYFASQDLNGIIKNPTDTRVAADIVCPLYKAVPASAEIALAEDKVMNVYSGTLSIVNDTYTDASAFKTAMSGVYLIYPLATPTTETADPYTSPQIVNDFGTEEFVIDSTIDVPIPVGHDTDYPINLKSKLEMAPDSPDGDGDYIVRQTNGTNEYVPLIIEDQLPAVPSTDGTYTLTVTIASGEATYSWT